MARARRVRWWWGVALGMLVCLVAAGRVARAHEEKDVVCGMMVDPHATEHHHDHAGRTYHF